MIEITITEELVDWLEERPYCLSREDWKDFVREFVERLYMVGGLRIGGADRAVCVECGRDIPNDGNCWYYENDPSKDDEDEV